MAAGLPLEARELDNHSARHALRSLPLCGSNLATDSVIKTASRFAVYGHELVIPYISIMNEDILDDGVVHLSGNANEQPLDGTTANTIIEAAKWGKYYLIIAAVGLVLQPVFQYFNMRKVEAGLEGVDTDMLLGVQLGTQIFTYMLMIAVFGYPVYRFYEFVTKTPIAIEKQNHQGFLAGIDGLRSTYKYLGIATLVIIGLYLLLIVIGIVAFVFMDLLN